MSSTASLLAATETPQPSVEPHRRRDKPQLSCTLCRKRKLKCDRGQPCETCVKRGLSLSCTYIHSSTTSDTLIKNAPRSSALRKMQERIGQLETLIASQVRDSSAEGSFGDRLAKQGDAPGFPPTPSFLVSNQKEHPSQGASELSTHLGRMTVENAGTTWVETDHWTAILDGISELKDSLEDTQGGIENGVLSSNVLDTSGPELLLGENKRVSKEDILAAIPNRTIVDRLVSQFLKSYDVAPMILHIPTFLVEYEKFWDHQEQASILWIGLLFAIMCFGVLQQQSGFEVQHLQDSGDSRCLAKSYRKKISQCLVVGNFTKPAPYTIETLLLYTHVEYLQSKDSETGVWILLGLIVRMALRMGYHRDACHFSRISPFHAEMRRRVWCVISLMDAGAAAQFGLPGMVRASQSNTAEPRNLLDEDINEDMRELPSARPESVHTPVQYFVAKNRLIAVSGKISDLKTLTPAPQYAEILRLDRLLHSTRDSIPQALAMRPMTQSILDEPSVIIQRMYLALIYYKAKCMLHRRYLIPAKMDERYTYSRTACIEAALGVLHIQQILDQETQPGGRLHADRGKVTSVMKSEFLLAITILCVDLDHTITHGSLFVSQNAISGPETSETVIEALHDAYLTWLRSTDSSREARQAVRVLKIVLDKAAATKSTSFEVSGTATSCTPATNSGSHQQTTTAALGLALEQASAVNEPPLIATPMASAYLQGSEAASFLDFPPMDFEMDQWIFGAQASAKIPDMMDDSSRAFGWSLTGDWSDDAV